MAKQLDSYDFSAWRRRRRCLFPEEWFNGRPWLLEYGTDFDVKVTTVQARYKQLARERGMVSQTVIEDADTIVVQAKNGAGK